LALLDRETRSFHAEADRGWHQLMHGGDTTRDDYIDRLIVTYGFESPFDAACSCTPGLTQVIDLRGRWRSGLIPQDLLAMGCVRDEVTKIQCYTMAPFQDAAEALAWMYVVERPTLIYAEIREELTSRFVDLARSTAYLAAYGGYASKRRSELGIALDQLCVAEKVEKRVLEATRAAFQAMIGWQGTNGPALRSVG
jgi:heme oxygenase